MKACIIGLDGATWDLLDPWLDDLPTIRSFAENLRGELDSCIPPISVPAWKCYTTGMNPGDLGVFTFVEPDFEERLFKTVSNETFTQREIWDYLSEAGYRSAAINIPSTYPPREIDGWMVSGPFSELDNFATPQDLQETLAVEGYTIIPDYYLSRDSDDLDSALATVHEKFDIARRATDQMDFVHTTLYVTDTVQHTEWGSDISKRFWEQVDAALGEFIHELDEEWNVILMSDHGFGKTEGIFYLNTWLEEQGYMRLKASGMDLGDVAGVFGLDYSTVKGLIQRLRLSGILHKRVPSSVLVRIARQMPGNRKLEGLQDKIDWDSDAIALAPLIYTKNQQIADNIRKELLALEDGRGQKVIHEVYYGEELYPDCSVRAPDLIVDHTDYVISDVIQQGVLFKYEPDEWAEHKIAHHRINGIVAARGPDIEHVDLDGACLYDLAPTILDGFGVDIPADMRGKSLGLLGQNGRRTNMPVDRDAERIVEHDEGVEKKLKDLGYL